MAKASKPTQAEPDEIAALIASAAPGVEAGMQQLEGAERAYYGAVFATRQPEAVVTSATTPYSLEPDLS
jgi:hypothetical protein